MATIQPDYLRIGSIVKIAEWHGQIVDIAQTETGKIMVLITSPKAIFRNHRDEWLEFIPDLMQPATAEDYLHDIEYYAKRTRLNLEKLERMAEEWLTRVK